MAASDPTPRPVTARLTNETVALQVQQFLDDWHYRVMSSSLGKTWSSTKTVSTVLDILALNGVPLTPEDISRLAKMDEHQMIEELVPKLPKNIREDFDHLALQLQMLVTAAARIRKSCDEGFPEAIQKTLEETDSSSIGQQILKQAVVQASKEVASLHKCQDTWLKSMDKRLDRLTRSAEFAEHAQQQLLAVEAQLERFSSEQSAKSKKALMGLVEGSAKALTQTVFSSWLGCMLTGKNEKHIRKAFEQEILDAERALFEYKEKQLKGVKGVLMRSARESDQGLLSFCVQTWSNEVAEGKRSGCTKEAMMELEAKLEQLSKSQSENTKKVLARMGADQDATLFGLAWAAWVKHSQDYKKDKEFEDAVKATEQQLKAHMQKKKDDAKMVLDRMNGATDSGLLSQCINGWMQVAQESKKSYELEVKMNSAGDKFQSLKSKHKSNAMSIQGRVNEQIKANSMLRCFIMWVVESKVNHIDKHYSAKMNHKRQQLASVQTLFKSFAKQLEEGLGNIDGDSSSARSTTRRSKAGMTKDAGTVSLPNIHARQGIAA